MRPRNVNIPARSTSVKLVNWAGRITWFSFRETTGAALATFRLWDGQDNSGALVAAVNLGPGESTRDYTGRHALPFDGGLFIEVLAGSVEGAVYVVPETEWPGEVIPVTIVTGVGASGV